MSHCNLLLMNIINISTCDWPVFLSAYIATLSISQFSVLFWVTPNKRSVHSWIMSALSSFICLFFWLAVLFAAEPHASPKNVSNTALALAFVLWTQDPHICLILYCKSSFRSIADTKDTLAITHEPVDCLVLHRPSLACL